MVTILFIERIIAGFDESLIKNNPKNAYYSCYSIQNDCCEILTFANKMATKGGRQNRRNACHERNGKKAYESDICKPHKIRQQIFRSSRNEEHKENENISFLFCVNKPKFLKFLSWHKNFHKFYAKFTSEKKYDC